MTEQSVKGVDFKEALRQVLSDAVDSATAVANRPKPPAQVKKPYRLTFGTHKHPNPDFQPDSVMMPELSHLTAQVGDIVMLTDDQYKAFRDRFVPADEKADAVASADKEAFESAKKVAAATGQMVDPNQSPQVARNPLIEEQASRAKQTGAQKG